MDAVDGITGEMSRPPERVALTYYRTQESYDEYGREEGNYEIVNARTREVAALLERRGITADVRFPEEHDERYLEIMARTRLK